MATLYLKSAGGNFNGANWSATSAAGVDSLTPTAADNCVLELLSGALTINSGSVCRSLDTTSGVSNYAGTITHTAAVTLAIGDATAGAGNVALKLNSGMTYTLGNATTSAISFISTSATQQTIATGGKTLGNWTINGAGSSYLLSDANTIGATATVTVTTGTLDTNGQTCSWGLFVRSGSSTVTLTFGASAITLTGTGTVWSWATISSLTVTANTATVTMNGAAASFSSGAKDWNGLTVVMSGSGTATVTAGGAFTVATFTRTGTAVKTDALTVTGPFTVTGTFTGTGNSVTNRLLVQSNTLGTARTITAATVSLTNVDFMDITGAGAASPFTGTSLGDCQGNSGITFTTAATQTWQGTSGGNWSDSAKWTSRVPLPQDDVSIASAFSASQTVQADMPRLGKSISWVGTTGSPTWGTGSLSGWSIFGSLTLVAAMNDPNFGGSTFSLRGRGAQTFTSAGRVVGLSMSVFAFGGSYTLQDALNATNVGFQLFNGTFDLNGFTFTTSSVIADSGAVCALVMTNAAVGLTTTGAGNIWRLNNANTTLTATGSTVTISTASANSRTFQGGGKTYGTLTYTVAGSTGALVITGANTFTTINFSDVTNARTLTLPSSTTTTVTNFNVNGTAGKLMTVNSSTSGVAATLSKSSGTVSVDYLSIKDSTATGGASWPAGIHSTNVSGNTGWLFFVYVDGGQATETDSANAGTPILVGVGSQATTTSSANAGTPLFVRSGAQATETDTGNAGIATLYVSGSQASTTSTASSGVPGLTIAGAQATETDAGNGGSPLLVVTSTQATETDTAGTGVASFVLFGTQATTTDTGLSGAPGLTIIGVQATETDTANPGNGVATLAGGMASESDTAFSGEPLLAWLGELATELDEAWAGMAVTVDLILGCATASDRADGITIRDMAARAIASDRSDCP